MPRILAIDPSTKVVGLYDGTGGDVIVLDKKLETAERLAELARELPKILEAGDPYDFVVYEEQFVRGGKSTKSLFGAVGIIVAAAINSGAGVMSLPQGTLRKWANKIVGKEFKGKDLYREAALHFDPRLNYPGIYQDILDAACMYYFIQHNGEYDA